MRRTLAVLLLLPAAFTPQFSTGEIRGSVINAAPDMLHSARIELRRGELRRLVQTGSGGSFRFTQLPPGVYDLTIAMDFYRTTSVRSLHLDPGQIRVLPPLELLFQGAIACDERSPDYLRPLDTSVSGKGSLGGRIIDDHSQPLSNANVRLYIPNVGILGSAVTDYAGRFAIPDVPARGHYQIEVAHDGFFTEDFSDFAVQPGYESFYDRIDLAPCEKDRCQPALRPIRPLHACL